MRRRLVASGGQAKREGGEPTAPPAVYGALQFIMKTSKFSSRLRVLRFGIAASLLGVSALATSGCLAVAAGAGAGATVAYVRGDLDTTLNANFERSLAAVNAAVAQLKYAKVSEKRDALEATVIARNASDKRIELRLDVLSADATKLKIRVGTFGDETVTQAVLEKIKANL